MGGALPNPGRKPLSKMGGKNLAGLSLGTWFPLMNPNCPVALFVNRREATPKIRTVRPSIRGNERNMILILRMNSGLGIPARSRWHACFPRVENHPPYDNTAVRDLLVNISEFAPRVTLPWEAGTGLAERDAIFPSHPPDQGSNFHPRHRDVSTCLIFPGNEPPA